MKHPLTATIIVKSVKSTEDESMCRHPTIREIQLATCAEFGVTMEEMNGRSRKATIIAPRQIAMMLASKMTTHSLPVIGKFFNRDHTTVLHGARKWAGVEDERIQRLIAVLGDERDTA